MLFRSTPFVDLPVSATEDRVVGTLDIEKAIQKGERHFDPGILSALDPKNMVKDGNSAPLHDGAVKYYKEKGWM